MPERLHANRICFVDPEKSAVKLVLHATHSLLVNLRAGLFAPPEESGVPVEEIILDTGYNSEGALNTFPEKMNNHRLFVQFRAQSVHPDFDRGKISLDILQDGRLCIISKPASWLRIVPKYGTGRTFEWTTVVQFCCVAQAESMPAVERSADISL
jgi:hypothetical protein